MLVTVILWSVNLYRYWAVGYRLQGNNLVLQGKEEKGTIIRPWKAT